MYTNIKNIKKIASFTKYLLDSYGKHGTNNTPKEWFDNNDPVTDDEAFKTALWTFCFLGDKEFKNDEFTKDFAINGILNDRKTSKINYTYPKNRLFEEVS